MRDARAKLGMGAAPVAKQAGISDVYLLDIEKGKRMPDPKHAKALASALGLRHSDVLRSILISRDPAYEQLLEPPQPGYFVPLTPLEQRKIEQFVADRGLMLPSEAAPMLIKAILFAYIDGKLTEVLPQHRQD